MGVVTRRSVYSARKWINKYGGTWKLRVSIIKIFCVYIFVNLTGFTVFHLRVNRLSRDLKMNDSPTLHQNEESILPSFLESL